MKKIFAALFFLSLILSSLLVYAEVSEKPGTVGMSESGKMSKKHKKHKMNKKNMKETKMEESSKPGVTGMPTTK
jgi:hypothetical protein